MAYKVKKHHEKLRLKNGINGHYLFDVDGKRIMIERILTISLTKEGSYFCVIAILRNKKEIELFSSSDFEYSEKKLKSYRKEFELLKRYI